MLQRQIMFKQLQELQRRQQLQELSNSRNQNYANQLSSIKQAPGAQFSSMVNGTPIQDHSGMFLIGDMMQHGGANGLVLPQSPVGLSQHQLDISLYGSHTPNPDKNLNQYSHIQGPSNLSANLLTKNSGSPLGMVTMQPSAFSNSFMSQHGIFPSDQTSMSDGLVHSNQEKDLFGQASNEGLHGAVPGNYSELGFTDQGNASAQVSEGRHEDLGWNSLSSGKTSNFGPSLAADSLDPLEQKILYNTDDNSWGSFSQSNIMGPGGFGGALENISSMDGVSSLQSGSWSALMQSALEETSGNDPGVQEEWSGLSFQNSEPLYDNNLAKFNDSKRMQNIWVNRTPPNAASPSSKPVHSPSFNMNSLANFQQSDYQFQKQKEDYYSAASHDTIQNSPRSTSLQADYNSQQKRSSGGTSLIQSSMSMPNIWPVQHKENPDNDTHDPSLPGSNGNQPSNNFSGHEFKGAFWLQGSTSHHVRVGSQQQYGQVKQLNTHGYSVEPQNMTCESNVEAVPTELSASLERPGGNMTAPSESMLELLNKDDTSNDQALAMHLNLKVTTPEELTLMETSVSSFAKPCQTSHLPPDFGFIPRPSDPQASPSYSVFPSLSIVSSGAMSLSGQDVKYYVENQHPASPVPSRMTTEVPLSGHVHGAKPSLGSERLQHAGFRMELPTQWQGMSPQHRTSTPLLFRSPESASSSIGTSSAARNDEHYHNSSQQEYNAKQYSGNSAGLEQQYEKESLINEGLTDIDSSTSLDNTIQNQERFREHSSETGAIGSGSLITDDGKSLPPKYDGVNYQHPSELSLSGQNSGNKNMEEGDLNAVSSLGTLSSGDHKGWKLSLEDQAEQSRKALLSSYQQNLQQPSLFSQDDILARSVGDNRASNVAYPSQISLPMVQSWFKQYETLKNGQRLPIYDPSVAIHTTQPSSEMIPGNMQDNSLNVQINVGNASKGIHLHASTAVAPALHKQLNPPSMLPSGSTHQNLVVASEKKRKLVSFEMVPWYKEVKHDQWLPLDISTAELSWAQAASRREEGVISEAEIVEDLHPVIQAKRRLICSTQLTHQIFRPAPSVLIFMDASSNCDHIAYYAARLALGDACSLTGQLPSETSDASESPDKPKTSRRTDTCKISKVVGGIICRAKKLEDDLTRLEKSLSVVDIKVEAQELEKFSTINHFAKFHIRAQQSTADTSSSGTSSLHKTHPQRYVVGHPMPNILPEGVDCLSL